MELPHIAWYCASYYFSPNTLPFRVSSGDGGVKWNSHWHRRHYSDGLFSDWSPPAWDLVVQRYSSPIEEEDKDKIQSETKHIWFKNQFNHTALLYVYEYPDDVQLRSSSLLEVNTLGGTLTIKATQKADAGSYRCVAVNAAGTSSGKISLDVGGESGTLLNKKHSWITACSVLPVAAGGELTAVFIHRWHPKTAFFFLPL